MYVLEVVGTVYQPYILKMIKNKGVKIRLRIFVQQSHKINREKNIKLRPI